MKYSKLSDNFTDLVVVSEFFEHFTKNFWEFSVTSENFQKPYETYCEGDSVTKKGTVRNHQKVVKWDTRRSNGLNSKITKPVSKSGKFATRLTDENRSPTVVLKGQTLSPLRHGDLYMLQFNSEQSALQIFQTLKSIFSIIRNKWSPFVLYLSHIITFWRLQIVLVYRRKQAKFVNMILFLRSLPILDYYYEIFKMTVSIDLCSKVCNLKLLRHSRLGMFPVLWRMLELGLNNSSSETHRRWQSRIPGLGFWILLGHLGMGASTA